MTDEQLFIIQGTIFLHALILLKRDVKWATILVFVAWGAYALEHIGG